MRFFYFILISLAGPAWASNPSPDDLWFHFNRSQILYFDTSLYKSGAVTGTPGLDTGLGNFKESAGGTDVIVAVIDTGADINHPFLKDHLAINTAECGTEAPDFFSGLDKDQNGFVADCVGWDFTKDKSEKFANKVLDEVGHGTHVAGIIASFANYSEVPLFKRIKILPLKVIGNSSFGLSTMIANALEYAYLRGAKVVNFSMGFPRDITGDKFKAAIKKAQDRGLIIVGAAGNNSHNSPVYPCAYEGVICVGSIRNDGHRSSFSNYGAHVDFEAPGSTILSSIPFAIDPKFSKQSGFDYKDGTSQAAPIISAFVASLLVLEPNLTRDQVYQRLAQNTRPRSDLRSINGFPSLASIFDKKIVPLVLPEFKNKPTITSDGLTVKFPLTLVNFSGDATDTIFKIDNITDGYKLIDSPSAVHWEVGEMRKNLFITLKADAFDATSFLSMDLVLGKPDKEKRFQINAQVIRKPRFKKVVSKSGEKLDVKSVGGIYEISSAYSESQADFMVMQDKTAGATLKLMKITDGQYQFIGSRKFPDDEEIPSFGFSRVLDLNGDGTDDLFLVLKKGKEKIKIYYLNQDLTDLYPGNSSFEYSLNQPFYNSEQLVSFLPIDSPLGKMKVPLFITKGAISDPDFKSNFWDFAKNPVKPNLYWLEPKIGKGNAEFVTRTLSSQEFDQKILDRLKLSPRARLVPLAMAIHAGKTELLESIYDSDNQTTGSLLLEVSSLQQLDPELFPSTIDFPLSEASFITSLKSGQFVYTTLPKSNEANIYLLEKLSDHLSGRLVKTITIAPNDAFMPSPASPVNAVSFSEGKLSLFLQAIHSIVYFREGGPIYTHPAIRHSILEVNIANYEYRPVTVQLQGARSGLYVDQSKINGNGVYVLSAVNNVLSAPLYWSAEIPSNCITRDIPPLYDKKRGVDQIFMVCNNAGAEELFVFPLIFDPSMTN